MTELLKQPRYAALDVADQIIVLFAGKEGYLDDLDVDQVCTFPQRAGHLHAGASRGASSRGPWRQDL